MNNDTKTSQVKLYKNSVPRAIYFIICLLLIGLYQSCGTTDDGDISPIINYDSLGISSFSVLDSKDVSISNTNAIPVDASFLLTFDQSLGNLDNHVNSLVNQIKLIDMGGGGGTPISLNIQAAEADQIKIILTADLNYNTSYQLTVKEGLTIGNYRVTHDITYPITTEKSSDSSLIVIYNNENIFPSESSITIPLQIGSDPSSVSFILEVGEGATLQDGNNNNLPLNENRQYTTSMDFSGDKKHTFKVTAQDGSATVAYTIGVSERRMDSKEILSFAFRETDDPNLKENIVMDVNTNNRTVTKTVTNVEGITSLVPTIVHNGSNISPSSGVAQDFSTNNAYTVTAIDKSIADYTVTLTNYYGVTINIEGGLITEAPTTEYILYGEKAPPPSDPSQEHYGFKGWYDASIGGNTFDFDTPITTQTIVYAQWTNKEYNVSFETYAGTPIPPVTVNSLTPVPKPVDPTGEHYSSFGGWYTDNTFTTRYDFNWVVSNDLTLYAKYIYKQYQVMFYQGANLLDTVSVASLATISVSDYPVNPNAGKAYRWYSNANLGGVFNKDALVIADVDLYAQEVPASFEMVIENRMIPFDLANYGEMSEMIFSNYTAGATVLVRYVKEVASGSGDGSSWANASGDMRAVVNGINDASENKVYVVLVASGTYKPNASYVMKNHVAIVGGFTAGSYDRAGETFLDGDNNKQVFNNNSLNRTALLYGVVITNGYTSSFGYGGGMYNGDSSPTLINVTFSANTSDNTGGGMANRDNSSPALINVIFSNNKATQTGGGMYNGNGSSPTLINVTLSGNEVDSYGGGMYNWSSSPTLINVTFSGNKANDGGGMKNWQSSPTLINVTFSDNEADDGGGMDNVDNSSPTLINVTFSGNKADDGGGMRNWQSSPTLINVTLSDNMVSGTIGKGGGIYHDGDGQPLTLINMILSGNNKGNIFVVNDSSSTEVINLYYSRIFEGINTSTTASGIRLKNSDTSTYPVTINSKEVITSNPELGSLADNGGEVATISIGNTSPAKDKGVYVRGVKSQGGNLYPGANLYYSENNTDWYSDPDLTTQESPPSDADDLTATDARGYGRVGRPDMGAYEEGGTAP